MSLWNLRNLYRVFLWSFFIEFIEIEGKYFKFIDFFKIYIDISV